MSTAITTTINPLAAARAQRIADAKAAAATVAEAEQAHSKLAYDYLLANPGLNWGECQKRAAQQLIAAADKTAGFPPAAREFLVRFAPDSPAAPAADNDPIAEAAAEAEPNIAATT